MVDYFVKFHVLNFEDDIDDSYQVLELEVIIFMF